MHVYLGTGVLRMVRAGTVKRPVISTAIGMNNNAIVAGIQVNESVWLLQVLQADVVKV